MENPTQDPSKTDYTFAGGLAGINPAELDPADIQKLRDVTDQGIESLKHRYDNPNWFKVAAGFAKPQLGGFLASLGSASEAMGENVEQERANVQPVVNAQILREQSNMLLGQKIKQNQIFQEWFASGKPMDENTFTRITSLGANTDIAKSAAQFWEQAKARVETSGEAQRLRREFPELDKQMMKVNPESQQEYELQMSKLDKAKPRQVELATWQGMTPEQKKDEIAKYADQQRQNGMNQEQISEDLAESSMRRLKLLRTARELGSDVDMAPVFSVLNNADAFSLIKKITDQVGGNVGAVMQGLQNAIRSQYTNENDPDGTKRAKADLLFKTIARITSENRNSAKNPNIAWQELAEAGSPSIDNTQQGFLSILDQMGLAEKRNIDLHNLRIKSGLAPKEIFDSNERHALEKKYDEEAERLAKTNPYQRTPSWFSNISIDATDLVKKPNQTSANEKAPAPPAPLIPPPASEPPEVTKPKVTKPKSSIGAAIEEKYKGKDKP